MAVLSKNKNKWIRSLHRKKNRELESSYIIEGAKNVAELIKFLPETILCVVQLKNDKFSIFKQKWENFEVESSEMSQLSALHSASNILAVAKIPMDINHYSSNKITLVLDNIQDPGNLGTIWRMADWFGISEIVCSINTVDCFNPKVIQASMGAFCRVKITYTDISDYLSVDNRPIYGAFMNGESIYNQQLKESAIIVLGNEGNGISPEIGKLIQHSISIPNFGDAESLNVASATAIILSEFSRNLV